MSDLISRQQAIDVIMDELKRIPTNAIRAKTRLEKLPPAQPEPQWIPVNERLPEENGMYLVTIKNLTGYILLNEEVFECLFYHGDWSFKGWEDNNVIAWMPRPTPYIK